MLSTGRSLLRERASLPTLPHATSLDDFRLGRFGSFGGASPSCSSEAGLCVSQWRLVNVFLLAQSVDVVANDHCSFLRPIKRICNSMCVARAARGIACTMLYAYSMLDGLPNAFLWARQVAGQGEERQRGYSASAAFSKKEVWVSGPRGEEP